MLGKTVDMGERPLGRTFGARKEQRVQEKPMLMGWDTWRGGAHRVERELPLRLREYFRQDGVAGAEKCQGRHELRLGSSWEILLGSS